MILAIAAKAAHWVHDQRLVTLGDGLDVRWQIFDGGNGLYLSYAPLVEGISFVTERLTKA